MVFRPSQISPPKHVWGRISLCGLLTLALTLLTVGVGQAQTYPRTLLERVSPPGGQVGTTVEVTLTGNYLDDITGLYVSDKRLKAEKVPDPKVDPKKKNPPKPPVKFKITIPSNMDVGVYDIRVIGKWGISNPRAFEVGTLKEIEEKEANNDVEQAQKVELNTTVNGIVNNRTDVDYYAFEAKKGQRIVLSCSGFNIDSRLDPLLELYDPNGKLLANDRYYSNRNAVVDHLVQTDGLHYVRLCQFAYIIGGNDTFYRLDISTGPWIDSAYPPVVQVGKASPVTIYGKNLPGGSIDPNMKLDGRPLEKATVQITPPMNVFNEGGVDFSGLLPPSNATMSSFEYRAKNGNMTSNPVQITFSKVPVVIDNEKNNSLETSQPVTLPGTICGRIEQLGDEDWYKFTAKKGEVYTVEGFADRLGIPVNLFLTIKRGDTKKVLTTIESHPEITDSVNSRFYVSTEDPKGRITIPVDGEYYIMAKTHTSYARSGPRFVYRVTVQKEDPDFQVFVVSNNTDNIGGFTLNQGGRQSLDVKVLRQDGFDGEILLEAEGLPNGVTCKPQPVGPKLKTGALVLEAAGNAPSSIGEFKVKATATIDGKKVTRTVRAACLVWKAPNNVPAITRLSRSLCLSVREKGPYTLETDVKEVALPIGGKGSIKIKANRGNDKDMKNAQIQVSRLAAPAATNGAYINFPNVNIAKGKTEGEVKYTIPTNAVPGTYNVVFLGKAKSKIYIDPKNKKKATNVDIYEVTSPIKMTLYNKVAELNLGSPKLAIKQGEEGNLQINFKRLYDFKDEFQVQLLLPSGVSGISAATVKTPKNAGNATLKIKVAANAKVVKRGDFKVRVSARVGNQTFTHEIPFELGVIEVKKEKKK